MATKSPCRETRTLCYDACDFQPKDWLRFIQLTPFESAWADLGLNDGDLCVLETAIMANPDGYPIISGTGGVRKLRFVGEHWKSGKRGGARVYYVYIPSKGVVFLLFIHMRKDDDLISQAGKKEIKKLVGEITSLLEEGAYDPKGQKARS